MGFVATRLDDKSKDRINLSNIATQSMSLSDVIQDKIIFVFFIPSLGKIRIECGEWSKRNERK
jgi:hypothetical protein